jgi:hypothetical protein
MNDNNQARRKKRGKYVNSFRFGIRMIQDAIMVLSILAAGERILLELSSESISW